VQIRKARNVLADHFWIGMGDTAASNGSSHTNGKRAARNGHGNGRRPAKAN
jgi:hypothetical protein